MPFPDPPNGYRIEVLDRNVHVRTGFRCGVEPLDQFIQCQAAQAQDKYASKTHVLLPAETQQIVGFLTVAAPASIITADIPESVRKKFKCSELPAVLLARMAVDDGYKRRHLGEFLLKYALWMAFDLSTRFPCYAIFVDAKGERAKHFYEKYGFTAFPDRPLRLFLPTATIGKLFSVL